MHGVTKLGPSRTTALMNLLPVFTVVIAMLLLGETLHTYDVVGGGITLFGVAWQPGDVVLWDNRCLLHAGSGYDADRHRRYMRQTRVSGTCPTLEEVG